MCSFRAQNSIANIDPATTLSQQQIFVLGAAALLHNVQRADEARVIERCIELSKTLTPNEDPWMLLLRDAIHLKFLDIRSFKTPGRFVPYNREYDGKLECLFGYLYKAITWLPQSGNVYIVLRAADMREKMIARMLQFCACFFENRQLRTLRPYVICVPA